MTDIEFDLYVALNLGMATSQEIKTLYGSFKTTKEKELEQKWIETK